MFIYFSQKGVNSAGVRWLAETVIFLQVAVWTLKSELISITFNKNFADCEEDFQVMNQMQLDLVFS